MTLFPYVTPHHFSAENFTPLCGLSLDAEFDLIAPVVIYFEADCSNQRRRAATTALTTLQRCGHPIANYLERPQTVLDQRRTPEHFVDRYNALVIAIADEATDGSAEATIDAHGAFEFRIGTSAGVLSGSASGAFAYYDKAAALRERLAREEVDA